MEAVLKHLAVIHAVPHNCSYLVIILKVIYELKKACQKEAAGFWLEKRKSSPKSNGTASFLGFFRYEENKTQKARPFFHFRSTFTSNSYIIGIYWNAWSSPPHPYLLLVPQIKFTHTNVHAPNLRAWGICMFICTNGQLFRCF